MGAFAGRRTDESFSQEEGETSRLGWKRRRLITTQKKQMLCPLYHPKKKNGGMLPLEIDLLATKSFVIDHIRSVIGDLFRERF
jgi:hypothetical protein